MLPQLALYATAFKASLRCAAAAYPMDDVASHWDAPDAGRRSIAKVYQAFLKEWCDARSSAVAGEQEQLLEGLVRKHAPGLAAAWCKWSGVKADNVPIAIAAAHA